MGTATLRMAVLVLGAGLFGFGCDDTRRDWSSCVVEACAPDFACVHERCVPLSTLGNRDAAVDEGVSLDGPAASGPEAGPSDVPEGEASAEVPPAVVFDAGLDQADDAPLGPWLDAGGETAIDPVDVAPDTRVPDAAGTCGNDGDCAGGTPYCVAGLCVGCKTHEQCHAGAPICSPTHACVSCAALDAGCAGATPTCDPTSGRCVECVDNQGCPLATKPVCDGTTNTCVPCARDAQCAGIGPGICMAHMDGHCAAEVETVFVGGPACSDVAANAGSTAVPFCSAQKAVLTAKARDKALMLISGAIAGGFTGVALTTPLAVVGRDAVVRPADASDGIGITAGELYLRGLTIGGNPAGKAGLRAASGGSGVLGVTVEGCTISDNPGGGVLLAGAAFEIRNTVVMGNGPGETQNGTTFGGIRVDSLPSGATARLDRVTIADNVGPGLSCAAAVVGNGVLASGNGSPDVTTSCAVTSCAAAGPLCGAP